MSLILKYTVKAEDSGKNFEQLAKKYFNISSGLLTELKYNGKIFINGSVVRTVDLAFENDVIAIDVSEDMPSPGDITPFKYPLEILYEDDFLLVVNKPGGMESHPCHSNYESTLANCVMYHWQQKGEYHKYHIVNRLDKDTSGISVIAKNRYAHSRLSSQMKSGAFKKYYLAVVHGNLQTCEGIIDLPIARMGESIIKREVRGDGKPATTLYKKISETKNYSLLDIELKTGRTHQIRVHFSHIGHPLVGDWLYGSGDEEKDIIKRQALHCQKVSFFHPATFEKIEITAPIPEDMKNLLFQD